VVTVDAGAPERLPAAERRDALLDAALTLLLELGPRAVTMGSVASRAGVARPLVYKHFANKDELLRALHHREASAIDRAIRHRVAAAPDGLEPKLRAFVAGVIEGVVDTTVLFAPLHEAAADVDHDATRQAWDRRTVGYFAKLAAAELGMPERDARSAVSMLLGGVAPLVRQARRSSSQAARSQLQERFVQLVLGALHRLAATT
jgi:AcrR family transcriptional regulator